ncbi:MAG: hypothetical protein ACRDIV_15600 [Ktedonobacteraceae bacterium]
MRLDEQNPLLQALRAQLEADQQQMLRCQRGQHDMLATATPGVVICRLCRTLGVCLWCGFNLPPGACISVCAKHIGTVTQQAKGRSSRTIEASRTDYEQEGYPHDL